MVRPLIAIIGSISRTRNENGEFDSRLEQVDNAEQAACALGKALADARMRILVFASSPDFLEAHVIAGYVTGKTAGPESIVVRYPHDKTPRVHGSFPEEQSHPKLFKHEQDTHERWERSFYMSLPEVAGFFLMGGGNATLITGLLALATKKPLVSLATFGGNAKVIWQMAERDMLATREEHQLMGQLQWSDDVAARLVRSFHTQARAAVRRDPKAERGQRIWIGALFFIVAVAFSGVGALAHLNVRLAFALCGLAVPIVAGSAGAILQTLWALYRQRDTYLRFGIGATVLFGATVGLISAVSFILAQTSTLSDFPGILSAIDQGKWELLKFTLVVLIIGLIAGMSFSRVMESIPKTQVPSPTSLFGHADG